MNVASDSAIVPSSNGPSLSGAGAALAAARGVVAWSLALGMAICRASSRLQQVGARRNGRLRASVPGQAIRSDAGARAFAARQMRRTRLVGGDGRPHPFV